jgi:hypothetical protein
VDAELAPLRWQRAGTSSALAAMSLSLLIGCGSHSSPHAATSASSRPSPQRSVHLATCSIRHPTLAPTAHPSPPPVPAAGAYLGAFSLHGLAFQQNYVSSFANLQQTACRPLDIAHVYLRWTYPFPNTSALALARSGHYLLVSWTGTNIAEMASGRDDAIITSTAHQLASLGYPIFLELRWEMDRPNLASVVASPAAFIAAWDRVRDLFAAAGVHNASWVWCPTAAGFADGRSQQYYPGDDEVDWVCADAYPSTTLPDSPEQQLGPLLAPFLRWAASRGKPAMIGEFGVPLRYTSEQRAQWFAGARSALSAAPIKAALYFDDNPHPTPARSYEIGSDSTVVSAFRGLSTDRHFRPPAPADPAAGR